MYKKLKYNDGCYKKLTQNSNQQNIGESDKLNQSKLLITVQASCCGAKTSENALEYYSTNIDTLKEKINTELEHKKKFNQGVCFVVFRSKQLSLRFRRQAYFRDKLTRLQSSDEGK